MKKCRFSATLLVTHLLLMCSVSNAQTNEVADLRRLVEDMRENYEARISDLEARLAITERRSQLAEVNADEAVALAEQAAIDQSTGASAPNTFNPSLGAVLAGSYANVDRGWDEIPGFQPGGEIGTGGTGFALGEAEINLKASVDNRYFGNLTIGVHEDDGETELGVEEAWLQTTGLPAGLSVTGGRFFSAAGYQNSFHFHADDFYDRPLPYQAFFGGRYAVDGLQARWVAPTSLLVDIGGEINWGGGFPATANGNETPGTWSVFAKVGGDVGDSHSWQAGVTHINAEATERSGAHGHDEAVVAETFTGDSELTVFDFVWKWAPQGNARSRAVKVQGEYFSRTENGLYAGLPYDGDQDGWYLQGVLQFAPLWRVGLRHDVVDASNGVSLAGTELEDPGRSSYRDSVMLDWSPSEYSRFRLQYISDKVLAEADHQLYLQYIMSIGAHGAHQF